MLNKIKISDKIDIVFSKDHCAYEEVIQDFNNADFINILTYNISNENNELLDCVKEVEDEINVNIITNIPNRFATYYSHSARQKARQNINNYMSRLNPDNFKANITTLFNFDNHSKIIMTNNVGYVGSANFSSESSSNFECGVIIRDKQVLKQIHEEIIPFITNESVQYFGSEATRVKLLFININSKLEIIHKSIHQGFYSFGGHRLDDFEFYDSNNASLSPIDLEELESLIYEIEEVLSDLSEEEKYEDIVINVDTLILEEIGEMIHNWSNLYKFSRFNMQNEMDAYLCEHALLADNENLDFYAQKAFEIASDKKESLVDSLKPDVDKIEGLMHNLSIMINDVIKNIDILVESNEVIDNT